MYKRIQAKKKIQSEIKKILKTLLTITLWEILFLVKSKKNIHLKKFIFNFE